MDPPNQHQSTNSPPPPLQSTNSPPQESEPNSCLEIQDSQFLTWFQEIFPGRELPSSLQPGKDSLPNPLLQSLPPRAKPLPWHQTPERLLLKELFPHLDAQCSDSDSQSTNVLPPRPPRPPRPRPPQQQENVLSRVLEIESQEKNVLALPQRPSQPPLQQENVLAPQPRQIASTAEPVRSPPLPSKCSPQCWFMLAVIFFVGFIICALVLVFLVIIYTLQ